MARYIVALDAGTTSNRCIIFDKDGTKCSVAQKEFTQYFPHPGWVEHDATEIWTSMRTVIREAMEKINASGEEIAAVGITNQRETTVIWDKVTGEPISPAIVWQCRRTSDYCDQLKKEGWTEKIREKTGLVLDAYFSGTKIRWILKNVEGAMERAKRGELLFGTIETWLIWNLSGGKIHITDYSNASRTMLFNIHTLEWDQELLDKLEIPRAILPEVKDSSCVYGMSKAEFFGAPVPLAGAAGDQQAALFGQNCFAAGEAKNTFGTGGFMLLNTGDKPVASQNGLVTTIAWGINGKITYALEGSIFIMGAAINWLRDELQIVRSGREADEMAVAVEDTAGCYVVPAFTGLGAPYWDQHARGAIVGLTRGTGRNHIVRATLDSLAYQVNDIIDVMEADSGIEISALKVDGGVSASNYLMQMQADLMETKVVRPKNIESTAAGAAYLAGLAVGYYENIEEISKNWAIDRVFESQMDPEKRSNLIKGWKQAVAQVLLPGQVK